MMKTYITRERYLARIRPFIGKHLIKIITGQRRVGKSYLLYQIMDEIRARKGAGPIIHIDKEREEFRALATARELVGYVEKRVRKQGTAHVFIDEVQEIADFEKALRHFAARGLDVYCTGSNARLLSSEIATILAGRAVEFTVRGLTYAEFLKFHRREDGDDALAAFLRFGGLPYLIHLELTDETAFEYLRNIYNTIVLKDIVARHRIRDVQFLDRLIEYVAETTGHYVSARRISDFLKSQKLAYSVNTVLNYLAFLGAAFIIDKVPRFEIRGRKVFEINDKYYFQDLGLRHALRGYRPADIGQVVENAVYNELKSRGYAVRVGRLGVREIDFVAERGGRTVYVQVAYLLAGAKTREREFGNLLAIRDNHRKLVVSLDPVTGGTDRGVEQLHLRKFLLEE